MYKKWAKVDSCFSFKKPTKWYLLHVLSCLWPIFCAEKNLMTLIRHFWPKLQQLFKKGWSRPHSTSLFWAFFLGMVYIFIVQKISPEWARLQPFLNICCNFGQKCRINVIRFFSAQNMGHNLLKTCSKYHLVGLLNEKQVSTFGHFLNISKPYWPP